MFAYFLNINQNNPTHAKKLASIQNLIKTQKISGELYEYTNQTELATFVDKNTSIGAQTLVAIGDDIDFTNLFNCAKKEKIAFGYIPLDFHSPIAQLLGLTSIKESVTAVSQRKITDYPCLSVNQYDILVQMSCELIPNQTANFEISIDEGLFGHTIANHVVVKNNLLVANESKPIELAVYRPTVSANNQTPSEDRLELPSTKKLFTKLGTAKEELILHIKAIQMSLTSSEEMSNDLFEHPFTELKINQSQHTAHLITKKQSARLH